MGRSGELRANITLTNIQHLPHHAILISNNYKSKLFKARTNIINPFTIATASTVLSDRPTMYTRNLNSRRGILLLKPS